MLSEEQVAGIVGNCLMLFIMRNLFPKGKITKKEKNIYDIIGLGIFVFTVVHHEMFVDYPIISYIAFFLSVICVLIVIIRIRRIIACIIDYQYKNYKKYFKDNKDSE